MAWTHEDEQPIRTRDELLTKVQRRGHELRRRRRASRRLASVVALLAVVGVVGSLTTGSGGDRQVQVATEGAPPMTAAEPPSEPAPNQSQVVPAGPSTTAAGPLTLPGLSPDAMHAPPPSPGPMPAPPPGGTTVTTRPATWSVPSTTPTAGPATTLAAPEPRQPRCGAEHLTVTAVPDKPAYGPGERVMVTSTIVNRTAGVCYYWASYSFSYGVSDSSGRPIIGGTTHADAFGDLPLAPGEKVTRTDASWDQIMCTGDNSTCTRAAPGDYTIKVTWGIAYPSLVEAVATFTLVP